jgi:hypothetical protein
VYGTCSTHGGNDGCIEHYSLKPDRKRPYRRPSHRLDDNIKMDFKELECEGEGWKTGFDWFRVGSSGGE